MASEPFLAAISPKPTNVSALFGDDGDSQPLWFRKEAFADPSFDSDAYIADLRRFVPLETLRTELKSHLTSLKSNLVELINRDYTDFVNLSTKLVDVDGAVLRMRMPLSDLQSKLLGVRESVAQSLDALQKGLERRGEASEARQLLELLLDTSHVLSKVEKLLLELQGMPGDDSRPEEAPGVARPLDSRSVDWEADAPNGGEPGGAGLRLEESRSRLLERIAIEMNRLKFYVAKAQTIPFVQNMSKRIRAAESVLAEHLSQSLQLGLDRKDAFVLSNCLRAYAALDDTEGAEAAFRTAVVGPALRSLLATWQQQQQQGASEAVPLGAVYEGIQAYVERDCRFLIGLTGTVNSGLHSFEFLSNSILREVHSSLLKFFPSSFSPGKPEEFMANYRASLEFLVFLEAYCPTKAAIIAFRQHPAYSDFLKQWNLGVYFNLRFRDIAGALDASLRSSGLTPVKGFKVQNSSSSSSSGLTLAATSALWLALDQCWGAHIYVPAVADKFLRLTLQLIARYKTWLETGLQVRKLSSQSHSRDSPLVEGSEWGQTATAEEFVLLRYDLEQVASAIGGPEFMGRLDQFLGPSVSDDLKKTVKSCVAAAGKSLLQETKAIADVLTETVAEKCIEVLRQLKGITATYRMTNKPLPTRHSHYVVGILQPMKAFLDSDRAVYLSQEARNELVRMVVDRVSARFFEMAKELVTMARKTESSLIRLRRDRRGVGADSGPPPISDTDKITTQLFLDVQEYGRQLFRFEVVPAELPSYVNLWQCVAPQDQQIVRI